MFKNHDRGWRRTGQIRDVRESLLKYSESQPPKAELYEIYKKLKSYTHLWNSNFVKYKIIIKKINYALKLH